MGSMFKEGMFKEQSAILGWLNEAKNRKEKAESSSSVAKGTQFHKMDKELSEIVQVAEQAEIVQIAEQASIAHEGSISSPSILNCETKPPFSSS